MLDDVLDGAERELVGILAVDRAQVVVGLQLLAVVVHVRPLNSPKMNTPTVL